MAMKKIIQSVKLTDTAEAVCVSNHSPSSNSITKTKRADQMLIHCTFGRRKFDVLLKSTDGGHATFAHLAEAIRKETDIPCDQQRLLFKGVLMDPPDMSGFTILQDLNIRSGDQVLVANSRRVATDDQEKQDFEKLFPEVKKTDKKLQEIIYELDRMQRGHFPCKKPNKFLGGLRTKALELEKEYMKIVQSASQLTFDYRNAVSQARRRELIDTCQRQMDKIVEMTSAIFDRLAMAQSSVEGAPVLHVAYRDGPCPRPEKSYDGPWH